MAMHVPAEPLAESTDQTSGTPGVREPTPIAGIWQQTGGFLAVGVVCTVASVAIFALLRPLTGVQWANLISLVLTSLLNTELNRRHSFGIAERRYRLQDHRRGLWVMLLALGLTSGGLWALHTVMPDASVLDELLAITAANVLAAVTRFLLLRYWIFRRIRGLL